MNRGGVYDRDNNAQSSAQLSKWTDAMSNEAKRMKAVDEKNDEVDDYEDEEFEAYDDDFDEFDEEEEVAPPKTVAKPPISKPTGPVYDMDQMRKSMEQENKAALERSTPNSRSHSPGYSSEKQSKHSLSNEPHSNSHPPPADAKSAKSKINNISMDFSASLHTSHIDPRMKRLLRLRGGVQKNGQKLPCIFDMQEESFTNLNIQPITSFDLYHRLLRQQPVASVKQCGVPSDSETREIEVMTDAVPVHDVGMQFCYGDDTELLELIEYVKEFKSRARAAASRRKNEDGDEEPEEDVPVTLADFIQKKKYAEMLLRNENVSSYSSYELSSLTNPHLRKENHEGGTNTSSMWLNQSSQMSQFLQKSSDVMENLLDMQGACVGKGNSIAEEDTAASCSTVSVVPCNNINKAESISSLPSGLTLKPPPTGLFSARSTHWSGTHDEKHGVYQLIQHRRTSIVCFSRLSPHLFITVHPYNESQASRDAKETPESNVDLYPSKGIYCIWDVYNPQTPLYVLVSPGQPTCVSFSTSQNHIVVAGTSEGNVYMWDLREKSSYHRNKDAIRLNIEKGIRRPCYTTCTGSVLDKKNLFMNKMEHNGKVLSIHGIGGCLDDMDGSSGHHGSSSHFISVDEYGCIMLWMTSEGMQNNIDSEDTDSASFNMISSVYDFGLSPWSNVKLGLSRSLDSAMKMPSHANASTCSELDGADYDGECDRAGMNFALCLPIPGESASTFLVHTDHSRVRNTDSGLLGSHIGASTGIEKVVRLGQPSTPRYYVRFQSNHDVVDGAVVGSTGESSYTPCVLSMDVVHLVTTRGDHSGQCTAPPARDSSESKDDEETKGSDVADTNKPNFGRNATVSTIKLMLAGRYDGTVDLYDMNIAMPLITWKPSDYIQNRKSSVVEGTPIYCVRWITHTSFLVVDQGGIIYYYDLLQNLEVPTVVDNSIHNTIETNRKKKKNLTLIGVDISTDMKYINTIANNHNVYMVFYTNTTIKNESFMVRKLNEKLGSGLITENSGAHNQNPNALKNNIVVGDTYFVEEVLKPWITRLQQGDGSYKSARPMEDAHSHK